MLKSAVFTIVGFLVVMTTLVLIMIFEKEFIFLLWGLVIAGGSYAAGQGILALMKEWRD